MDIFMEPVRSRPPHGFSFLLGVNQEENSLRGWWRQFHRETLYRASPYVVNLEIWRCINSRDHRFSKNRYGSILGNRNHHIALPRNPRPLLQWVHDEPIRIERYDVGRLPPPIRLPNGVKFNPSTGKQKRDVLALQPRYRVIDVRVMSKIHTPLAIHLRLQKPKPPYGV